MFQILTPYGHVTRYSEEHRLVVTGGRDTEPKIFLSREAAGRFVHEHGMDPATTRVEPLQ